MILSLVLLMRLFSAKMGGAYSSVKNWLVEGVLAAQNSVAKWIWATVTWLCKGVYEVLRHIFGISIWFCGSYKKDKVWNETTAEGRAEV